MQLGWQAANHELAERGIGFLARVAHACDTPCTHDGAGGAQGANFVQLVADVQNAAPLCGQLAQHHKQLLHRLRREHRGGLVQDEQLRVGEQGADDFHPLHFAHAQCVHGALGVNVQAVLRSGVGDALGDLGQAQRLVEPQPHVLSHTEGVKQAEVLKHHADTQAPRFLRVANVRQLAVEAHLARVGLDRAVDDFHER